MAGLTVNSISISEMLDNLRTREWLTPKFQRDFLWSIEQIKQLINSIINGHPIGMITLWAQPDEGALELEPLSIPDSNEEGYKYFSTSDKDAKKRYAILDGRQRSTSIAMAFGGFRADNGNYKYSGRFFLNVSTKDETNRIEYFKESDLRKKGMESVASQISHGYFPLFTESGQDLNNQWMDFISAIRDAKYYDNNELPKDDELRYREEILRKSFNGIINTKIAVYIVPEKFDLGEICEIFETLNTTGTKVSTVDLIHSWLYSDTIRDPEGPVLLRDWIQEMSERDGSIGWADTEKRPELMAQISTACYIAQENKPKPRKVGGRTGKTPILSVKAGDLLATPKEHWKQIIKNDEQISEYLADFQDLVANGRFPWTRCPYPVSSAIYVALRWNKHNDNISEWGIDDINALYKAFFWKNALAGRYDQGFLTQLGTDLKVLKSILQKRKSFRSANEWAKHASEVLDNLIGPNIPDRDQLYDYLTNGRPGGALQKALHLLLYTGPKKDPLNPDIIINFPFSASSELHHIYPKSWCKNNITSKLSEVLDINKADRDWVNSTANLMLLSRESNNQWKSRVPSNVIEEWNLEYENLRDILKPSFIDEKAFYLLKEGPNKIKEFWIRRTENIIEELLSRLSISL